MQLSRSFMKAALLAVSLAGCGGAIDDPLPSEELATSEQELTASCPAGTTKRANCFDGVPYTWCMGRQGAFNVTVYKKCSAISPSLRCYTNLTSAWCSP